MYYRDTDRWARRRVSPVGPHKTDSSIEKKSLRLSRLGPFMGKEVVRGKVTCDQSNVAGANGFAPIGFVRTGFFRQRKNLMMEWFAGRTARRSSKMVDLFSRGEIGGRFTACAEIWYLLAHDATPRYWCLWPLILWGLETHKSIVWNGLLFGKNSIVCSGGCLLIT